MPDTVLALWTTTERQRGLTTGGNCQVRLVNPAPRACLAHSRPLSLGHELGPSPLCWGSKAQRSALPLVGSPRPTQTPFTELFAICSVSRRQVFPPRPRRSCAPGLCCQVTETHVRGVSRHLTFQKVSEKRVLYLVSLHFGRRTVKSFPFPIF